MAGNRTVLALVGWAVAVVIFMVDDLHPSGK
jgi:hypothetical protein